MYFPLKMEIFHCYVSLPEGNLLTPVVTWLHFPFPPIHPSTRVHRKIWTKRRCYEGAAEASGTSDFFWVSGYLPPWKLTYPLKNMVERCISYWNIPFFGDMLIFRGVENGGNKPELWNKWYVPGSSKWHSWWLYVTFFGFKWFPVGCSKGQSEEPGSTCWCWQFLKQKVYDWKFHVWLPVIEPCQSYSNVVQM